MIEVSDGFKDVIRLFVEHASSLGWTLIKAFAVFIICRILINMVHRLIKKVMNKRQIEPSIKSFVESLVNVVLTILLIVSVVGALGVQTTSFAAYLLQPVLRSVWR